MARRAVMSVAVTCAALPLCGCRSWPWRCGPVPNSVAACRDLSNQALAAIEQGQWQYAEELLSGAIETCSVDPDARRYYAEVLVQRGAIGEALIHLEETPTCGAVAFAEAAPWEPVEDLLKDVYTAP